MMAVDAVNRKSSMTKKAIIVFVKNPEPGKVKTRLAKDIGDAAAVDVYRRLLQHTHDALVTVDATRFVFYADTINRLDLWEKSLFYKHLQQGNDLGERMQQAFAFLFDLGYERVLIIGSDCPQLCSDHLNNAFELLETNDVCIGPVEDGGYYLLGLHAVHPALFTNKAWSTDTVFSSTMKDAADAGISVGLTEKLRDVDTLTDWEELKELLDYQKASPMVK
jgi:rSAM/selenodomain-associated transferase 1